jgi:hypothetical protein
MKRLYFIICLTVLCYNVIAQNPRIPKEWEQLLPLSLSGKVRWVDYPTQGEALHIIKYVDTKEEADIWIAVFAAKEPKDVVKYNTIKDKQCVWLVYNEWEDSTNYYFKLTHVQSIYSGWLKDYHQVIKFCFVPYGQHGINTKKPNNALLYTKHNPDPDIQRYINTLPY